MTERLQKILARHGLGSRREIERWMAEGRVTVNRERAKVGDVFRPGDRVAIDGKEVTARLSVEVAPQVLMFHKAQGQPITHDERRTSSVDEESTIEAHAPDTGETVIDRLPAVRGSRWIPINPMHPGDSGLLLVTNDGNLSYALTRRKRWIPTTYMVRILAPGAAEAPPEIPLSVSYDTGRGAEEVTFDSVEPEGGAGANLWYCVQAPRADCRAGVRALFESRNLKVSRMTQTAFGSIELPRDLPRGRHRALSAEQLAALYELAQIKMPSVDASVSTGHRQRNPRAIAPDRRRAAKKVRSGSGKPTARNKGKSRKPRR